LDEIELRSVYELAVNWPVAWAINWGILLTVALAQIRYLRNSAAAAKRSIQ